MVADAITGNISTEATTQTGNIFADATRRMKETIRRSLPRPNLKPRGPPLAELLKASAASLLRLERATASKTAHGFKKSLKKTSAERSGAEHSIKFRGPTPSGARLVLRVTPILLNG